MDKHKDLFYKIGRFFFILALISIMYYIIKYFFILFYPFALAFIFALMINPLITYLAYQTKISRFWLTVSIMLLIALLFFGVIILIIIEIIQGSLFLADHVPTHFHTFLTSIQTLIKEKIIPLYQQMLAFFQNLDIGEQEAIDEYLDQTLTHFAANSTNFLQNLLLKVPQILALIPYSLTIIMFIFIATFLIAYDWPKIKKFTNTLVPVSLNNMSQNIFSQLKKTLLGYLKAQGILISITVVILVIGLLVLRIEHAITIAFIISLIDLIPFIGLGIIFFPWIIYAFMMKNYVLTIGLTITYMVIIISRQILEPKILADQIGLSPLIGLFILYTCFQIWGMIGVLIAPIMLVMIGALHQAGIPKMILNFIRG